MVVFIIGIRVVVIGIVLCGWAVLVVVVVVIAALGNKGFAKVVMCCGRC